MKQILRQLKRFGEELQTKTPKRLKEEKDDEAKDDESTKKLKERKRWKERYGMDWPKDKLEKGFWKCFDKMLWGDLMIMFNQGDTADFWDKQLNWKLISWKLHSSSGVHTIMTSNGLVIHMLVENRYPLTKEVLSQMLDLKLETEEESSMALELIKFVKQQLEEFEDSNDDDLVTSDHEETEREVILFYSGLEVPTRQILDSKEEGKTLEEAYYTQFGVLFQQGGQYRAAAPGFYQRNNANPSYQEQIQSMEESLSKYRTESAKIHEENSNLIKEIRASTDAAIRNHGASIKTLEIQIGQISKVLQERGFGSLLGLTKINLRDHVKSISTTIDADMNPICCISLSRYAVSDLQNSMLIFMPNQTTILFPSRLYHCDDEKGSYRLKEKDAYLIRTTLRNDALSQKEKDLGSFTLPFYNNNVCFEKSLANLGASISVMPFSTYTNLGLGELAHTKLIVELADKTVKHPKVPLILRRPFSSTAHAKIDVFKRKITLRVGDENIIFKSVKPASSLIKRVYKLSLRERMELDLEARLMGETLILNRSLDPLNGNYIKLNNLNEPFELRRNQADDLDPTIEEGEIDDEPMAGVDKPRFNDEIIDGLDKYPNKLEFKGKNIVGTFINVPIFVGNFSVMTNCAVIKDTDNYKDDGMGDVIVGKPFCREVRVKTKRFEGMITISNGNDNMTYQMVQSQGLNTAYPGPYRKEENDFGGILIFWNSMCCSHAGIQTRIKHTILLINAT
ncbi:hypothetical protein Tco_1154122 [Tanacetum coccineum]